MQDSINQKAMDRYLTPVDAWAMAFGCMIGWGAFVMPGTTMLPVAGPVGTIIAMAIGMAVMLIIGSCTAYLMQRSPRTGGIYSYTKEAFGRDHAFLCSWFLCLSYLTVVFLNGSALFIVIRTIFGQKIQSGYHYTMAGNRIYLREVGTSVLTLTVIGVMFIVAKPILQRLHTILTIILFAGVIITAAVCLPHSLPNIADHAFGTQGTGGFGVFSLVILAPWAFVGFEIISFDTAHFRFKVRKSRWILLASILMAGFTYIAMTLVSISAVPDGYASWSDYIVQLANYGGVRSVPTFFAAHTYMGTAGLVIMGITALAAILTGIIGAYRATMRVLSTMAEDKILSRLFSKTSYSILFVMVLSVLISLLGRNTLNWFVDLTSFGAIVAYGYTCAAAIRTARSQNNRRVLAIGVAGTAIAACFIIVQLIPHLAAMDAMGSEAFLLLSFWCLLGFIFYWRTIHRSTLTEYSGMSVSGIVLFALLVYSALLWLGKYLASRDNMEQVRGSLKSGGILLMIIIFTGLVVMLYIQAVVRRKHEEAEREKIRAVEGNLAKSRFLFNMSHDIRTPMNAIIGYTNLAKTEESQETVREYLGKISASSEHLLELINDILEMSRIEAGKTEQEYEPVDLCKVFEEIGDLFTEQMKEKKLRFKVYDAQVSDRYVWCDRKNLRRVLINIIGNAYKFTPEGGNVTATLLEAGSAENGYSLYEMRIQDNGRGMSREFADKMFTAFERERNSTESGIEGTGLGLAITKSLIDLMGGTIDVLTSPGDGTEMIIRMKLRLADQEEVVNSEEGSTQADEDISGFEGRRVLLVEDNEVNMEIARMILTQMGFEVETAGNGQIALDMVKAAGAGFYDVILMDIQMPVMDGYEAAGAIRAIDDEKKSQIPIIAMTANAFSEDVKAAKDAGMQAHVAKPVDISTLACELRKVLVKETQQEE